LGFLFNAYVAIVMPNMTTEHKQIWDQGPYISIISEWECWFRISFAFLDHNKYDYMDRGVQGLPGGAVVKGAVLQR
jgi:hypothetical protein